MGDKLLSLDWAVILVLAFFLAFFGCHSQGEADKLPPFELYLTDFHEVYSHNPVTSSGTSEIEGKLTVVNNFTETMYFDLIVSEFYSGSEIICVTRHFLDENNHVICHYPQSAEAIDSLAPLASDGMTRYFSLLPEYGEEFIIASANVNFALYPHKKIFISLYKDGEKFVIIKYNYDD